MIYNDKWIIYNHKIINKNENNLYQIIYLKHNNKVD